MKFNSTQLNEKGEAMCISCRKKFTVSNLKTCVACDRFVCASCATYRKQGNPYGYICKRCNTKLPNN